ncbi:MAG TPA: UbiA family prenyltransferase [Ktedonobacteraceae bacterium]|nr:UbiA family prenyltransferase [Ktedonobacteraceae bacterium]
MSLYMLSHRWPVLLRIFAVSFFTLLAARGHVVWSIIALVIGAYAAMQVSIALMNDYCKRERDAQGRLDIANPHSLVSPRIALTGAIAMMALMAVLLAPLPPLTWVISLCYLALGQGYNLKLKATMYGSIVFALVMLLIPVYAFVGVGRIVSFLFWLVPIGFLLGVTLNLANSLPTIEEDTRSGAQTLTVTLGVKRSFMACQLLIVVSATLIGLLAITQVVPTQPWVLVTTLILACLGIEAMLLFFGPEKPIETRRLYFYVVALTCIALAGGWLLGVIA